jgi:hypothetical protein
MSPRAVHAERGPTLLSWADALRAAQAAGYTHFRLQAVNRGDGTTVETDRPYQHIADVLEGAAEDPDCSAHCTERVEWPRIVTVIAEGPFAGTVLASYDLERRRSVWERLRSPEV